MHTEELENTEAYRVLLGMSHIKSGTIPPEILARHALETHWTADWPVQRAAMEALLRRCESGRRDKLRVSSRPPGGEIA